MMTIAPACIVSIVGVLANALLLVYGLMNLAVSPGIIPAALLGIGGFLLNFYLILLFFGGLTIITEWNQIHCKGYKKILSLFTFPFYVFTYIPISVVALFKKVEWTPITHTIVKTIEDVRE